MGDQILQQFGVSSLLQFCPTLCLVYQNKSRTKSFPIQVLEKTNDRDGTCAHTSQFQQNSDGILLYCRFLPTNFIEHGHEDDSIGKVLRFTLKTFHEFLNLFDDAYRCESWEDLPLEFRLHAVDAIQFLEIVDLRIPCYFIHPSCVWVISHLAHTKLSRRRHKLWQ